MAMSNTFDAICPIFVNHHDRKKIEQVGSGVLIQIANDVFLLTAAHVADIQEDGDLLIPGLNSLTEIYGHFAQIELPHGTKRADDKIDIAYFHIAHELVKRLHPQLKPLSRDRLFLTDILLEGDVYTFAGYPWRKSKISPPKVLTELFLFTGGAAPERKYRALGYEQDVHILIKFDRKKVVNIDNGKTYTAPLPHGVSGGAVFRRPKDILKHYREDELDLVAIAHTYLERQQCMVGTSINAYLACIFRNNPKLIPKKDNIYDTDAIPMFINLVWYKKEEWQRLKSEFDDSDKMHENWEEWRQASELGVEHMAKRGNIVTPIELSADEISEYCRREKISNTSRARTHLAGLKMAEWFFEKEIKPRGNTP